MHADEIDNHDVSRETDEGILETLGLVTDLYNRESRGHVKRIRKYAQVLLKHVADLCPEYGLTEERIRKIVSAVAIQDIGEIAIPDNIIMKPGILTDHELKIMKTHPLHGCKVVESLKPIISDPELFRYCYEICRYHHERYDGDGYPDGLVGEEIPIAAQVVSLVEMYDLLTISHVYMRAHSHYEAIRMIKDGHCGVFSPKLMECFEAAAEELEELAGNEEVKDGSKS